MRVVFMGSPAFSLPTLNALAKTYDLIGVFTQPDRPAGRGQALAAPAVKVRAAELGVPIYQPRRLSEASTTRALADLRPDLIVVAAYGQILKPDVLALPPFGCLNVHASLLPRWRGASPVQAAILNGDSETGVTIMKMDEGLDTGPILKSRNTPIRDSETGGELETRLADLGAELLVHVLPAYLDGELSPQPQDDEKATYAPLLRKADGALDFSLPAERLARQVRAFEPWPKSFFQWGGKRILLRKAHASLGPTGSPGRAIQVAGLPAVETGDGLLHFDVVQPEGKQPMTGDAFLLGARTFIGSILEKPGG